MNGQASDQESQEPVLKSQLGPHETSALDQLNVAARTSESLSRLLRSLIADGLGAGEASSPEALSHEEQLRERLLKAAESGVSQEDLTALIELVDALDGKQNDILLMVKLAEQAESLAAVLTAHRRVLVLLATDKEE